MYVRKSMKNKSCFSFLNLILQLYSSRKHRGGLVWISLSFWISPSEGDIAALKYVIKFKQRSWQLAQEKISDVYSESVPIRFKLA